MTVVDIGRKANSKVAFMVVMGDAELIARISEEARAWCLRHGIVESEDDYVYMSVGHNQLVVLLGELSDSDLLDLKLTFNDLQT